MKMLSLTTTVLLLSSFVASQAIAKLENRNGLDRISDETGVPVATLRDQRSATGLGYGELEKANLLATASGQSFDTVVAKRRAHEGWGKIAHDYGLNLGKVVSSARRSSTAAAHAHNQTVKTGKQAHSRPVNTGKRVGKTRQSPSGKSPQLHVGPDVEQGHGHGHRD